MKILVIDIETSPNLAYVWGLWDQNVGLNQLEETAEVLCFSAKWLGEKKTMFFRGDDVVPAAHRLLDEADAVIHYNGKRFDIPHLNREFVERGWLPPSPFKQIDLMQVIKQRFRFPSNKLDHVAQKLGLGGKAHTGGFELWRGCMRGEAKAWKAMEKYNRQDVEITEKLYYAILPWIGQHPNGNLYGVEGCPTCGSERLMKRGYAYTNMSKFQQYQCQDCGKYFRSNKRLEGVSITEVVR